MNNTDKLQYYVELHVQVSLRTNYVSEQTLLMASE